ncbi:hypothetical protein ACFOUP_18140 [Belliella kenyensis]|uniref:tRNA (Guanine-N1)-methyltransferase n=1 Tax=Belliella kenyensis TaxID=1472724 RepID=A0ABV8ESY0_9BACT|nr:hypothetical protein [Belliella kenyensis]MCH7402632.1 hypothetical protein [Belliella kenyensis]MDN3603430.1 hypothetical protein [Belliella kenyensis]
MNKTIFLTLFASLFLFNISQAQDSIEETGSLSSGTISSQFDYLLRISNNFQEYKVVKKTNLDRIKANVLDSLGVFEKELATIQQTVKAQQEKINELEAQIQDTQEELAKAEEARDSFFFLGIPIHKSFYNTIMWTIVAVLLGAFLFFLYKFSRSHKVIALSRKNLAETVEEFEQHRKNTLERERKLKRELVDALNGR